MTKDRMTKDPKEDWKDGENERISHERALDEISKKVDEKLSQISSVGFDEEMERRLAEIQELRRLEKEALEKSRSARRQKRQKKSGYPRPEQPAEEAREKRTEPENTERKSKAAEKKPTPVEKKPTPVGKKPGPAEKKPTPVGKKPTPVEKKPKAVGESTFSIAELAAQAVAEAEHSKKRRAMEQEAAIVETVTAVTAVTAAQNGAKPGEENGKTAKASGIQCSSDTLDEDRRVAQAVDQFFNTAEEIAAEKEKTQPIGAKVSALLCGLKELFCRIRPSKDSGRGGSPGDSGRSGAPGEDGDPGRGRASRLTVFFGLFCGALRKTAGITKELHVTRKGMDKETHLTHEKRMARYRVVWARHLKPVTERLLIVGDWIGLRQAQFAAWAAEVRAGGAVRFGLFRARVALWMERAWGKALLVLDCAEKHKMTLFRWFAGVVVCAGIAGLVLGHLTAYEYMYNGRVLGMVKNQEVVYKTIDVIGGKLSESLDADIEIDKELDISFRKVIGLGLVIDSKDDVLNSLTYMKTLKAKGYAILADGKQIAVLQSREAADGILDSITDRFSQQEKGVEYKKIGFAQDVKVEEIDTELGNIQNTEEVTQYMLTGAVEKKIHVVEKGQTFNAIAKSYGLTPSELEASNPGVLPDKLKIDQELFLNQDSPVLTVQTTEVATYTEEIPYEISYEDTDAYYKGEKKVKLKGVNGQREVVAEVVRNNGSEVSRTELSSTTLSEPTGQIVLVGTKDKPKTAATGSFSYPVRGYRISSRFGSRWGRTHTGVDLACSKGTNITAADGGTVTFSGYKGSYGYLVIIDHGNGKETYYAHCSKLLVSRGDKVYKGQSIAKVGSTGRSTGPHVHFEVRVNGVPKNPLNYL